MILGRIVNTAGSARCGIFKKIFEHQRQRAQATYMPVKSSTMNIEHTHVRQRNKIEQLYDREIKLTVVQ